MIVKIVSLFLVVIGVLAMFGKLRWLSVTKNRPKTCRACGRHLIGKGPCPCQRGTG